MSNNKIDSKNITELTSIKRAQLKNCIESDNRRRTLTSTTYWIRDNIKSSEPSAKLLCEAGEIIGELEREIEDRKIGSLVSLIGITVLIALNVIQLLL